MRDESAKRILLITHFLPPSHTAGTEQYTLGLGKSLRAKGHEVSIICAEDWDSGDRYWNGVSEETYDGLSIYRIHLNWTKANNSNKVLYDSLLVEKWLDEFLSKTRFDIVHVTSTYSLGVGVLRSVKRANLPLILTLMDFWFLCPSIQLLRSNQSLCDGVTTSWQCQACLMEGSHFFQRMQKISFPDSINARIWGTLSHVTRVADQRGFRGRLLDMEQRKKITWETFTLPDLVISPSRVVYEMFARSMSRPIMLLAYGHDLSWLNEYRGKSKSDRLRIGYLGQIQRTKGVHVLIDGFIRAGIADQARLDIWGNHAVNPSLCPEIEFDDWYSGRHFPAWQI